MRRFDRLAAALKDAGAILKRDKKHSVYRLPNGKTFVASKTPSDSVHAEKNALSDLRAALGTPKQVKPSITRERRAKPGRAEVTTFGAPTPESPLAAALRTSGVEVESLRARIADLELLLSRRDLELLRISNLRIMRLWRWFGGQ